MKYILGTLILIIIMYAVSKLADKILEWLERKKK